MVVNAILKLQCHLVYVPVKSNKDGMSDIKFIKNKQHLSDFSNLIIF